MVTSEGEDLEDDIWERGTGEEVNWLGVCVDEETGLEREGVGDEERGGVVKGKSDVVKVESDVEEGSAVGRVSIEEENGSSEEVEVKKSGVLVGDKESDKKVEVDSEGSIVRKESEGTTLLELKSAGRDPDEKISVEMSVDGSGSPDVGVGVSNVPVLDGNASVSVGSSVCVSGGGELTSKEVGREGVDTGKSVGVSVERVRW